MLADSSYELGAFHHLVIGNSGRLLDSRRTPVTIVGMHHDDGMFVVRIEDFEDCGVLWEIPYENVSGYQFIRSCNKASSENIKNIQVAVEEFNKSYTIPTESGVRKKTLSQIDTISRDITKWLSKDMRYFSMKQEFLDPSDRKGSPQLMKDLKDYLVSQDLWEMEESFSRQFVSNPNSGEMIKGHRIVVAEMGLVSYEGKIQRNKDIFSGGWSKAKRAEHIMHRMAFVQSVFRLFDCESVALYRGLTFRGKRPLRANNTFISSTFCSDVAESHMESADRNSVGVLYKQFVPVERLFMTYYETAQMNNQFLEAEAVLLYDKNNAAF